ncbi:AUGMIN subunit 6 [Bienertia sinuspersici]
MEIVCRSCKGLLVTLNLKEHFRGVIQGFLPLQHVVDPGWWAIFVELLWQLSLHALREVHRRTFPADVASNALPSSLTDVAFSHAAALLPVTKARIALERQRFLKNAEVAVQRQAMWSNLAHEMTAEYRGLCAEEAYLQQELEKLQELRNKAKMEAEIWDERTAGSSQSSHLVSKATRLWESLLSRKSQHEVLASGPIEDLIAHREQGICAPLLPLLIMTSSVYMKIFYSVLCFKVSHLWFSFACCMDQSSQVLLGQLEDQATALADESEQIDLNRDKPRTSVDSSQSQTNEESRVDDRSGRGHPTVDVAEILRRWTHALQRIHKQSLQLAKSNDGEGPEILRSTQVGGTGHAECLSATLVEHRQHLASIQVLINQLKDVAPAIQNSIAELTEEVNTVSSSLPLMNKCPGQFNVPLEAQSSGKAMIDRNDDITDVTSKMSNVHLEKVAASSTLKLPPLFSLTPNSTGKGGSMQKSLVSPVNHGDNLPERKSIDSALSSNRMDTLPQDTESLHVQKFKQAVREAALAVKSCDYESSRDSHSEDGSEHFFVPLSSAGVPSLGVEQRESSGLCNRLFTTESDSLLLGNSTLDSCGGKQFDEVSGSFNEFDSLSEYDRVNGFLSASCLNYAASESQASFYDLDEASDQVFSPPLLMETSLLADAYEDLLGMLSWPEKSLL